MFTQLSNYGNYLINDSGVIIDKRTNDTVRITKSNQGFLYVNLDGNLEYVHELVTETFLKNVHNFDYIIHRDNDLLNNHISNLKWNKTNDENIKPISKENSKRKNPYEVYNEDTGDSVLCIGRSQVAELIQYEEISLKNMVGNDRKITLGPYKGYKIRRVNK